MSGVLKTVSKIAGIASAVLGPINPALAAVAAAVSVAAGIGASLTAKDPIAQGSSTEITIGANMPAPYIMGERYYGGNRVHMAGYGTERDVPNAYLGIVDVYSVGGPINALTQTLLDFTPVTFTAGNADGYYIDHLHMDYQLGATPEADALSPHWSGLPDWDASSKLSGKAAILWNAIWTPAGKKFSSGFPQTGAVWQGVKVYDPREDSTYPGGSGTQRWAEPTDATAFTSAKATWAYSTSPALHALRYALGTWEQDAGGDYRKTYGIGLPLESIIAEDFVDFANVCEDNGWECNGIIFEPADRWDNLKSILQAGGAEPCFRNGRLGLKISAPRIALDTITRDDLVDAGDIVIPAMRGYTERVNTIIPEYCSAEHKWEYVASNPVQVAEYLTEDGEEKAETLRFNCVTGVDQAAQLGGYKLVDAREIGPIELPCSPRLRGYGPGDMLTLDLPEFGLGDVDCVVLRRSIEPATMVVSLTLITETEAKHAYALGLTGTSPPAITIQPPEIIDAVVGGSTTFDSTATRFDSSVVTFDGT